MYLPPLRPAKHLSSTLGGLSLLQLVYVSSALPLSVRLTHESPEPALIRLTNSSDAQGRPGFYVV